MKTTTLAAGFLAAASTALAGAPSHFSSRPHVKPAPKHPQKPFPSPAARTKYCTVKTHGNGTDDSAYILSAFHQCNNGGHVLFAGNTTYTIGTAMDWTFLKHIDIGEFFSFLGGQWGKKWEKVDRSLSCVAHYECSMANDAKTMLCWAHLQPCIGRQSTFELDLCTARAPRTCWSLCSMFQSATDHRPKQWGWLHVGSSCIRGEE